MSGLGVSELFIVLFIITALYLIPIVAGVWALLTLRRIRVGQEDLRRRLETIERSLQRTSSS